MPVNAAAKSVSPAYARAARFVMIIEIGLSAGSSLKHNVAVALQELDAALQRRFPFKRRHILYRLIEPVIDELTQPRKRRRPSRVLNQAANPRGLLLSSRLDFLS